MMKLIRKIVEENLVTVLILSFLVVNSWFWLFEDITGLEHKVYWYDIVQINVWVVIAVLITINKKEIR